MIARVTARGKREKRGTGCSERGLGGETRNGWGTGIEQLRNGMKRKMSKREEKERNDGERRGE